jgi:hypothetical protein
MSKDDFKERHGPWNFDSTSGTGPQAPLIQANDGNFYGVTAGSGAIGEGRVNRLVP